jgi:DNA repair photolyase
MDHAFENVEIKINAPELLERKLRTKRKKCMIGTGAMSDPYIPISENLRNIRACLEIIEKYRFGLAIQTKSSLILRDMDLLKKISSNAKCIIEMTLTTFDEKLCKIIEPNVSATKERFDVLKAMRDNDIQTIVWLSPILPFINDTKENLAGILDYCVEAGVYGIICFGMGVTLREGDREYFYKNLDKHFTGMNYLALKGEVSDFSSKNLSLDRKLSILCGFIPRNLWQGTNYALKLPREPVSGFLGITPALSNKLLPLGRQSQAPKPR